MYTAPLPRRRSSSRFNARESVGNARRRTDRKVEQIRDDAPRDNENENGVAEGAVLGGAGAKYGGNLYRDYFRGNDSKRIVAWEAQHGPVSPTSAFITSRC